MKRQTWIILVCCALVVSLSGCLVYAPSSHDMSSADYGPKPSKKDCLKELENFGEDTLKYPGSAKYRVVSEPERGWVRVRNSSNPTFGWIFEAEIDAKVRKDGDRERLEYVMMYRKGRLIPITYDHSSRNNNPVNYPYGFRSGSSGGQLFN